jgi:hypothetical protein
MAGKGLELYIGANTKDAVKGLDQIGDGLEQVQDDLGDTAKDSDKLERKFSDDVRDMQEAARKTGRVIGDDIKDGTRKAGEGMDTLKDESKQSLRETAASVKDVSDGLDLVQEVAANALIGFGPAGMIAGAAAAVGIGFVGEALRSAQAEADETKARIASMYSEAAEEGRAFLDEAQIQAEVLRIMFDEDQTRYQSAVNDAQILGLSRQEVVRALAGDQEALNHVIERSAELEATHKQKIDESIGTIATRGLLMDREGNLVDDINRKYTEQKKQLDDNAQKAAEYLGYTQGTADAVERRMDALNRTPTEVQTKLNVDETPLTSIQNRSYVANVSVRLQDRYGRNLD